MQAHVHGVHTMCAHAVRCCADWQVSTTAEGYWAINSCMHAKPHTTPHKRYMQATANHDGCLSFFAGHGWYRGGVGDATVTTEVLKAAGNNVIKCPAGSWKVRLSFSTLLHSVGASWRGVCRASRTSSGAEPLQKLSKLPAAGTTLQTCGMPEH